MKSNWKLAKNIDIWHPWFAWFPTKIRSNSDSDEYRWVWLENIKRKAVRYGITRIHYYWIYSE